MLQVIVLFKTLSLCLTLDIHVPHVAGYRFSSIAPLKLSRSDFGRNI